MLSDFITMTEMTEVKVRLNQWAPHKDVKRLFANERMSSFTKILAFPSVFFVGLIARPFSGLIVSDYYHPATNTIHVFSDDIAIALHEAGHAMRASGKHFINNTSYPKTNFGFAIEEEYAASSEALYYLEVTEQYDELLRAYRILIPAYMTYIGSYTPFGPIAQIAGVLVGHIIVPFKVSKKKKELIAQGKITPNNEPLIEMQE